MILSAVHTNEGRLLQTVRAQHENRRAAMFVDEDCVDSRSDVDDLRINYSEGPLFHKCDIVLRGTGKLTPTLTLSAVHLTLTEPQAKYKLILKTVDFWNSGPMGQHHYLYGRVSGYCHEY